MWLNQLEMQWLIFPKPRLCLQRAVPIATQVDQRSSAWTLEYSIRAWLMDQFASFIYAVLKVAIKIAKKMQFWGLPHFHHFPLFTANLAAQWKAHPSCVVIASLLSMFSASGGGLSGCQSVAWLDLLRLQDYVCNLSHTLDLTDMIDR